MDHLLKRIHRIQALALGIEILIALLSALAVWFLAQAVSIHYLYFDPILTWILIGGTTAFLISRSAVRFHTRSDWNNARAGDRICDLEDRLTTYVELRNTHHPFLDALARESRSRLSNARPWKIARIGETILLPALFLAILSLSILILPFLPVPASVQARKQDRKAIAAGAEELESDLKKLAEQKIQNPELLQLLKQMEEKARDLRNSEIDRTEALKQLNAWKEQLENQERRLQDADRKKLQEAWDQAFSKGTQGMDNRIPKDYESMLREYEKKMKDQTSSDNQPLGKDSAANPAGRGDLEKMKKALEDYQSKKSERDKAMAELKESMEQARKNLGTSAQKRQVVTDSKIKDRDLEKSKGGVEDGPGTTNKDIGPQHFSTKKKETGGIAEDKTKAGYEQIYSGERVEAGKDPLFLDSEWNPDGSPRMVSVRTFGLDSNSDPDAVNSTVAEETGSESEIRKEKVPARYRKIVQEYFERIQPD